MSRFFEEGPARSGVTPEQVTARVSALVMPSTAASRGAEKLSRVLGRFGVKLEASAQARQLKDAATTEVVRGALDAFEQNGGEGTSMLFGALRSSLSAYQAQSQSSKKMVRLFMSGEGLAASSGYRLPDEVPAMLGRRLDATLDAEAERFSRRLHQFLGTRDPDLHPESLATFVDAVLTDVLGKRYTKKP